MVAHRGRRRPHEEPHVPPIDRDLIEVEDRRAREPRVQVVGVERASTAATRATAPAAGAAAARFEDRLLRQGPGDLRAAGEAPRYRAGRSVLEDPDWGAAPQDSSTRARSRRPRGCRSHECMSRDRGNARDESRDQRACNAFRVSRLLPVNSADYILPREADVVTLAFASRRSASNEEEHLGNPRQPAVAARGSTRVLGAVVVALIPCSAAAVRRQNASQRTAANRSRRGSPAQTSQPLGRLRPLRVGPNRPRIPQRSLQRSSRPLTGIAGPRRRSVPEQATRSTPRSTTASTRQERSR